MSKRESQPRHGISAFWRIDVSALRHRRFARGSLALAGVGAAALLIAVLATPEPSKRAAAVEDPEECQPWGACNIVQEPGPARPWQGSIGVSTYSSVNMANGNVFTAIPIVSWSGVGPDMSMMLYHNSANAVSGYSIADVVGFDLGPGWSISYSDHIRFGTYQDLELATVVQEDGTQDVFTRIGSSEWGAPLGVHDTLIDMGGDVWRVYHKDQSYHEFQLDLDGIARLSRIVDATGNAATPGYDYQPPYRENLISVTAAGRYVGVSRQFCGPGCPVHTTLRTTPESGETTIGVREWVLEHDANGRISQITDPMGFVNSITYVGTTGKIDTLSDKRSSPTGADNDFYKYEYSGIWVSKVTDPDRTTDPNDGLTQEFSFANCTICFGGGIRAETTYTDRRGSDWSYRWTPMGGYLTPPWVLESVINPLLAKRTYWFDGGVNLMAVWDPPVGGLSSSWGWSHDEAGNMISAVDPLGNTTSWTYNSYNNVTSATDALGHVTQYKYENPTYPTLLTKIIQCPYPLTNPATDDCAAAGSGSDIPTTTMGYYINTTPGCEEIESYLALFACHGQLKEVVDPNDVWTGFAYDQWGQLTLNEEGRLEEGGNPVYWRVRMINSGGWPYVRGVCHGLESSPQGDATAGGEGGSCGKMV